MNTAAPSDHAERLRFITASGNFSVIAPAGVGKTSAIIARIVHLAGQAQQQRAPQILSRLIVVTYSVRAAQELQTRARLAVHNAGLDRATERAFQQIFFGTIHSYCVRLIERFGPHLGLPGQFDLLKDERLLWHEFLQRGAGPALPTGSGQAQLFAFFSPAALYQLAREVEPHPFQPLEPFPPLDLAPLFTYADASLPAATARAIAQTQALLQPWAAAWARGDFSRLLPDPPQGKAERFNALWHETFAPLREWLQSSALRFSGAIAQAYATFRLERGALTYADQTRLAGQLLQCDAVLRELRAEHLSVLLDEAQDTDPLQFQVLLRVAGLGAEAGQGARQSLAIVGDFQQAIYYPRSDLPHYRRVHEQLTAQVQERTSTFAVTFRCDQKIIDFANAVFPTLLHGEEGQSAYFPLQARAGAGSGQVVRWICPPSEGEECSAAKLAIHQAVWLGRRLAELGLAGFGVSRWSEIAVLCPRNEWLALLQNSWRKLGLPVQFQPAEQSQIESTPRAWLTALLTVATQPDASFELVGVLRDIFGLSDDAIARYCAGEGARLSLSRTHPGTGEVAAVLRLLREAAEPDETNTAFGRVTRLLQRCQLEERLAALRSLDPTCTGKAWRQLLGEIGEQAGTGATLEEIAQNLRAALAGEATTEHETENAIQLVTSFKAKGLEWPVVILPNLFRAIGSLAPRYPRVDRGSDEKWRVSRNPGEFHGFTREFFDLRQRQQLQRLFYVATTRAQQTLLLIDDEQLFAAAPRKGRASGGALLAFNAEGTNRATWLALPTEITRLPPRPRPAPVEPDDDAQLPEQALTPAERQLALLHARQLPQRITPHRLVDDKTARDAPEIGPREVEDEVTAQGARARLAGLDYGTWWHEMVQHLPWPNPADWAAHFAQWIVQSPDPTRSQTECRLLAQSPLAEIIRQPDVVRQCEIPFLWPESPQLYWEGIIDLAIYQKGGGWRIIDWKTNQLATRAELPGLVETYRGQLEAYRRALAALTGQGVVAMLYATSLGESLAL